MGCSRYSWSACCRAWCWFAPSGFANFPQRWFVIFLSSLTANHLLVTLIAALGLDPLQSYRAVTAALITF